MDFGQMINSLGWTNIIGTIVIAGLLVVGILYKHNSPKE